MKTNFLLDKNITFRNKQRISRRWSSFGLAVAALALYLIGPNLANWFSGVGLWLAAPFVNQAQNVVVGMSNAGMAALPNNLLAQNQTLKAEVEDARSQLLAQANQLEELGKLRNLLGRASTTQKTRAISLAKVTSRPPYLPNDLVMIDLGRNQNQLIKVGDQVYAYDTLRLGEVIEVYDNESKVELYSSPAATLSVVIGGTSTPAISTGLGNGNFMLKVPKGLEVNKIDVIRLSSTTDDIIGYVGKVIDDPANPLLILLAKAPVNIYALKWLEIHHR